MNSPAISIIIPTRNRRELLVQTLASVQHQTFGDWEALVVDDGSNDGTYEQVLSISHQDPRIKYIQRTGPNSGAPACRNQGIAASEGEYIIFLDSDDCLAAHALENRFRKMEQHRELDFGVFGCILFRHQPGDTNLLWNADTGEDDIDRFLANDVSWQTTSPIWRRAAIERLGSWDETLLTGQDWDQHLRGLILNLKYQRFSPPDCFWRMPHSDTIGSKSKAGDYLFSRERLLFLAQQRLEEASLLTSHRRVLLRKQYFWLADTCLDYSNKEDAFNFWRLCYERDLLDRQLYSQGLGYLKIISSVPSALRRVARKLIREWGNQAIAFHWPKTFRNTPIKVIES